MSFPQFYTEFADDDVATLVKLEDGNMTLRFTDKPAVLLDAETAIFGIVSNGEAYVHALKGSVLPDDKQDTPLSTELVLDNVSVDMANLLRSLTSAVRVGIKLVFVSAPDLVIRSVSGLRMGGFTYDAEAVHLDLSVNPTGPYGPAEHAWPSGRQTWSVAPGLHR